MGSLFNSILLFDFFCKKQNFFFSIFLVQSYLYFHSFFIHISFKKHNLQLLLLVYDFYNFSYFTLLFKVLFFEKNLFKSISISINNIQFCLFIFSQIFISVKLFRFSILWKNFLYLQNHFCL